jgi:hypothetical protein
MKLKNFCTTKEMFSKLKRSPTKWEKIYSRYIRQRTYNQNIRGELKKLNSSQINEQIKWATELNKTFSKEKIQITKKHMKKCSTSLAIKEMQIKTTLRFQPHPC